MSTTDEIVEFLRARILEDEREANICLHAYSQGKDVSGHRWKRVLAECAAKRMIIGQHEAWPVMVTADLVMEKYPTDLNDFAMRASQQIMWLTERQYVARFGTTAPTAPMIQTLAAVYADHPDYQQAWVPETPNNSPLRREAEQ
ncbi:DUF6221 family protein [Arthrobacter rhombi]|uniref:DUF6221 family protein n=1 Tax=Arthrobacter rhombi TaxID=71253 RepID=UPI003FD57F10